MGKVILDISMSLDGFIAGSDDNVDPLHDWIWRDNNMIKNEELMQGGTAATTGAMVVGKRTYDLVDGWQGNHPIPGVPVFVLSHSVPQKVPKGKTPITFVTDGLESAILQAKAAAGDKNVYVIGGANVAQQCIHANLLDEIRLHIVSILLGNGIRLFDHLGTKPIELETTRVIEAPGVTHLRFRPRDAQRDTLFR